MESKNKKTIDEFEEGNRDSTDLIGGEKKNSVDSPVYVCRYRCVGGRPGAALKLCLISCRKIPGWRLLSFSICRLILKA